ncbi:MAG: tRNA (adenosine(37)-N6)-threonylcarbamoyltransferase complex transferase subunit TsaD [Fibrobacter sp.]|nr:tRNA (adenosine(37)-N6)-threonylcarbamoyltransferase complex transferase subunit TsaD [Fibrobacter sp.]
MKKYWLGIESSCDETACAIVSPDLMVLANPLYSQIKEHNKFGGVVPEIAARAHLEKINPIAQKAFEQAQINPEQIQAIAYTCGPGLMGPLLVGASFAKGLAVDLGIPAYGINHLEGHLAAAHLSHPDLDAPYLSLTVSGGHTELVMVEPQFKYSLIGRTRDDAAGEAFDKCGKLLGLDYPAGSQVSKLAATGNRKFVRFPRAFHKQDHGEFSFSGLKTSVLRYTQTHSPEFIQENLNHICASLEEAIVSVLVEKSIWALKKTKAHTLVVGGGVSANGHLRTQLQKYCDKNQLRLAMPALEFCTDNGAMIAAAAILRQRQNLLPTLSKVSAWMPLAK